jgi:hypothetical protein
MCRVVFLFGVRAWCVIRTHTLALIFARNWSRHRGVSATDLENFIWETREKETKDASLHLENKFLVLAIEILLLNHIICTVG